MHVVGRRRRGGGTCPCRPPALMPASERLRVQARQRAVKSRMRQVWRPPVIGFTVAPRWRTPEPTAGRAHVPHTGGARASVQLRCAPTGGSGAGSTVQGVVQGVGFRPFAYALARQLGLAGQVRNSAAGVEIEIEGAAAPSREFVDRIAADAPALAVVEQVAVRTLPTQGGTEFVIAETGSSGVGRTLVSPDVATCADCLRELADPHDRRHRHAFISCTNCGPRFTIITGLPYDRPNTTMATLPLCGRVRRRVRGPVRPALPRPDRRLPRLRTDAAAGARRGERRASATRRSAEARRLLAGGAIVAVKGSGRLPPRLRRVGRSGRRDAAQAQGPRRQAVRRDGGGRSGRRTAGSRRAARADAARRPAPTDRPAAPPRGRSARAVGVTGPPGRRRPARVHPGAPPAVRPARRPARPASARHDQRQPRAAHRSSPTTPTPASGSRGWRTPG